MAEPDRPLLAALKDELARGGADLGRMVALRWQLARLEWDDATAAIKRLGVPLAAAGVMALAVLPVLVICLADWLNGAWPLAGVRWALVLGLLLAVVAGVVGWLAWRRFRREFVGLEETMEELREDVVWLKEWTGHELDDDASRPDPGVG